jgi:hypothetical protein
LDFTGKVALVTGAALGYGIGYGGRVSIGVGFRRRSASQAIDLQSDEGVNLGRLFTNAAHLIDTPAENQSISVPPKGSGWNVNPQK